MFEFQDRFLANLQDGRRDVRLLALRLFVLVAGFFAFAGLAQGQVVPNHFDPTAREEIADLSKVPAIRFLTSSDFPPFNYRDAGGNLVGFNVDLSRAICANLSVPCTLQDWPWGQAADALADNQGDALIAGLAISPEAAERFDFSSIYLALPGRFVVPRGNAFDGPSLLAGKQVAVRRGTAHEVFIQRYVPGAVIKSFDTEIDALEAVASGQASAYFGDAMRASFWLNSQGADVCCTFAGGAYFRPDLFGEGFAVAVPAGRNGVRDAINFALVRLKRTGKLDELYLRWFPVSFY